MTKYSIKTPLTEARNLGPVTVPFLMKVGIESKEDLISLGWEEAGLRLMSEHPRFINLNLLRALIGACLDLDFREIPAKELEKARSMLKLFKESSR